LQEKARERKKQGLFIIEGLREIGLAKNAGYQLKTLLFCPALFTEDALSDLVSSEMECIELSLPVYQKLAYRSTTEGILAIAKTKMNALEKIQFKDENPLLLVAEAPEKPGNIGALLRTADAANLDAVLIANPKTDLYNPNIIRSSVGGVFTNQIATASSEEIITFLKKNDFKIYAAALQASEPYNTADFSGKTAIVVGTEATGLTDQWLENSTQNIHIPMQGAIDSMNVSVAAGILIFEAKRQRNFS
jgi:TrmH family RNA methyltransferase